MDVETYFDTASDESVEYKYTKEQMLVYQLKELKIKLKKTSPS